MANKRSKRNKVNQIQSHAQLAIAKLRMAYGIRRLSNPTEEQIRAAKHLEAMAWEHEHRSFLPSQSTFLRSQ